MKALLYTITFCCLLSCSNESIQLDFIEGHWKVDEKEQYEVWEKSKNNTFSGYAYTLVDHKKVISETLKIKPIFNHWVLEATVLKQNSGQTVSFVLNTEVDSILSFENLNHDFPKKIQYLKQSNNQIKVSVLGENNKGFSYIQVKQ